MTLAKKFVCAVLLLSLFALAGCPEVAQQSGSGGSQSGGEKAD
jgi:hypothetical protein